MNLQPFQIFTLATCLSIFLGGCGNSEKQLAWHDNFTDNPNDWPKTEADVIAICGEPDEVFLGADLKPYQVDFDLYKRTIHTLFGFPLRKFKIEGVEYGYELEDFKTEVFYRTKILAYDEAKHFLFPTEPHSGHMVYTYWIRDGKTVGGSGAMALIYTRLNSPFWNKMKNTRAQRKAAL
jgi:hypothetical protein